MPSSKFTPAFPFKPHEVGPCSLGVKDGLSGYPLSALLIGTPLGVKITADNAVKLLPSLPVNL